MLLLFNLSLPRLSPANKESFEIIRVLLNIIDPDTVHYSHFSQHVTESHKHHHIPSTNSLITCLLLMKKNWFKDALTAPGNPFQIMHSLAISSNNIRPFSFTEFQTTFGLLVFFYSNSYNRPGFSTPVFHKMDGLSTEWCLDLSQPLENSSNASELHCQADVLGNQGFSLNFKSIILAQYVNFSL